MTESTEELNNEQYYLDLLDALIEENNVLLKNRLQKADSYTQFIQEQSKTLMSRTISIRKEKEVSFIEASNIAIAEWKEKTLH